MSKLPKLKVKQPFGYTPGDTRVYPLEETYDLEEAKHRLSFNLPHGVYVIAEGQVIRSYEELVQLATQERYKDKELLQVVVALLASGG